MYTSKRKILIPLPNTGTLARKKQLLLIRIAIALFVIIFIVIQLNVINYGKKRAHVTFFAEGLFTKGVRFQIVILVIFL